MGYKNVRWEIINFTILQKFYNVSSFLGEIRCVLLSQTKKLLQVVPGTFISATSISCRLYRVTSSLQALVGVTFTNKLSDEILDTVQLLPLTAFSPPPQFIEAQMDSSYRSILLRFDAFLNCANNSQ